MNASFVRTTLLVRLWEDASSLTLEHVEFCRPILSQVAPPRVLHFDAMEWECIVCHSHILLFSLSSLMVPKCTTSSLYLTLTVRDPPCSIHVYMYSKTLGCALRDFAWESECSVFLFGIAQVLLYPRLIITTTTTWFDYLCNYLGWMSPFYSSLLTSSYDGASHHGVFTHTSTLLVNAPRMSTLLVNAPRI